MKEQNTSRNIQNLYELSPMQAGMLFHSLLDKESDAYKEQYVFSLDGEINSAWLEKSFNILIERYDIFRTVFVYEKLDEPVQVVLKERTFKMPFEDISHFPEEEKQKYIETFKNKDIEKGFDLSRDLLMRIYLFKTGMSSYKLIWTFHHIIMDGWCIGNVFKEWIDIYKGLKYGAGKSPALKPVTQYKHYIKWLQQQDRSGGLQYWKEYLEGYERQTGLPGSREASIGSNYQSETYDIPLDDILSQHLVKIAGENKVTINILFRAMWGILLGKYNNTCDVVFGAVVSGRPPGLEGIENMIGLFINTIPVRIRSSSHQGYSQLIRNLREKAAAAKPYEYLPLAEIQANSLLKGRLIDHILIFENFPLREEIKEAGLKEKLGFRVKEIETREQTNYDLNIVIIPGRGFTVEFAYNSLVYDRDLIERAGWHLEQIVKQVMANPGIKTKDIEIITAEEKKQILVDFNQSHLDYPLDKTIHQLFAEQVERTPDHTALIGQINAFARDISVAYRELNERSNRLAHLLKEKGVTAGTIVAIMVERSVEMVIGLLGILKSGGAYLPLDPDYPEDRIIYMLKDSEAMVLLSTSTFPGLRPPLPGGEHTAVFPAGRFHLSIYSPLERGGREAAGLCLPSRVGWPRGLAYIIYTSGTTGKPKGVMVEHRNAVNLVNWFAKTFDVKIGTHLLQLTDFTFDPSVEDIFGPLLHGATLYISNKELLANPDQLRQYIVVHQVHLIDFIPSFLKELLLDRPKLESLRTVISGGERLEESLKNRLLDIGYTLYNNYGPTEITVDALFDKCSEEKVSLGKPLSNVTCYILDKDNNLAPIGVIGELCIAGAGVSRGYLNKPELTFEKFINCKLQITNKKVPGERIYMSHMSYMSYIYRTGDLARWRPDGKVEYIGRQDYQIKLRGYRIELAGIETLLKEHPGIENAVATPPGEKENLLIAYYVMKKSGSISISNDALQDYLKGKLPDYMIPAYFIQLEKIPLTSTGKIDRKALPGPEVSTEDQKYKPPGNEMEEKLMEIWREVLGVEKIGTTDNFFQIGGDSIKAIQLSARLRKYQLDLKINDLFLHPTIKESAKCVKPSRQIPGQESQQGTIAGEVPLTPIQQWFFENNFTNHHHYNHAVMLYSKEGFNETIIRKLFTKIALHHDALRMIYRAAGDKILQWNRGTDIEKEGKLFDLEVFQLTHLDCFTIEREANRIQAGIDLTRGPLMKLGLFKTTEGDHLLIVIHHLVVDGISWRILFEDFRIGCRQLQQGEEIKFQEKTISFRYWAQQLKEYSQSKEILRELEYWEKIEKAKSPPLPVDYKPGKKKKKYRDMESLRIDFNEEETGKLLKDVHRPYNTNINDILLTALGMAIKEWSGNETVVINLEGHGREPTSDDRYLDTSRTIGWFTCQFPVLLDMSKASDLSTGIKVIKETLRRIPNKGIGCGLLRYLTPGDKTRGIHLNVIPEISFNYLGQFHETNDSSVFTFSQIHTGKPISPEFESIHKIDINGVVKGETLTFSFTYNTYEYRKETIERLVHGFKTNLIKIIEHCTGRDGKELTPSDLGDEELSLEELEDIKDMISL